MFLFFGIFRKLVYVVLVLAIPLIVGEFIARSLLGDAVNSAIVSRIGGKAQVGFGTTPVLLQLVNGHLGDVSVSESKAQIGGLPTLAFNATLDDVHLSSITHLEGGIGAITLTAHLDAHAVRDLLATPTCVGSLPPGVLDGLTEQPRVKIAPGHIALLPPHGSAVDLHLFPAVAGGAIIFHATSLSLDGKRAPAATLTAAAGAINCARTVQNLPFNLQLKSTSTTPGLLDVQFAATNASFSAG
jgi:hypothetical protein